LGINFNAVLETGNLMLDEEVKINSEIQLVKQAVLAAANSFQRHEREWKIFS